MLSSEKNVCFRSVRMKVFKNIVNGLQGCHYKQGANGNILLVMVLGNGRKHPLTDNEQMVFNVDTAFGPDISIVVLL